MPSHTHVSTGYSTSIAVRTLMPLGIWRLLVCGFELFKIVFSRPLLRVGSSAMYVHVFIDGIIRNIIFVLVHKV